MSKITESEKRKLKKTFKKHFTQGIYHQSNVEDVYRLIREACEEEFTEDNEPTLDAFLSECYEKSNTEPSKPRASQWAWPKAEYVPILKDWEEGDPMWHWEERDPAPKHMNMKVSNQDIVNNLNNIENLSGIIELLASKIKVLVYSLEEGMYVDPEKPISEYKCSELKIWDSKVDKTGNKSLELGLKSIYNTITSSSKGRLSLDDETKLEFIRLICKQLGIEE